jgi:hypothetical protein
VVARLVLAVASQRVAPFWLVVRPTAFLLPAVESPAELELARLPVE